MALRLHSERYLKKRTRGVGGMGRQTVGMGTEGDRKCKHVFVTSPPVSFTLSRRHPLDDHAPCRRLTDRDWWPGALRPLALLTRQYRVCSRVNNCISQQLSTVIFDHRTSYTEVRHVATRPM